MDWSAGGATRGQPIVPGTRDAPCPSGCCRMSAADRLSEPCCTARGSCEREMAVRIALGAGRQRLRCQLVTETLPLGLLGAGGGVLLAWGLMKAMVPWLPPELPRVETLGLHAPVLAFAIASSLALVLVAGFLPARLAARVGINEVLQQTARSVSGRGRAR